MKLAVSDISGFVMLSIVGWLLTSCVYDYSDCYVEPHTRIRLVVDWRNAPNANPDGLAACFFPADGTGEIWRFDIPSSLGGYISLPAGEYRMLLFNNDASNVFFKDVDSYNSYDAYTLPTDIPDISAYGDNGSSGYDDDNKEPLLECPDMLWRAILTNVVVTDSGVSCDGTRSGFDITCYPDELCARYFCRIKNVSNLDYVKRMFVTLSGMSGSVIMATGNLSDDPSVIPVEAVRSGTDDVEGSSVTFGRCRDLSVDNILTFYVKMSDGTLHKYLFDVTDQVLEAPDRYNVYIEVSGIDLPEPAPSHGEESTLDVEVVDWSTTYIQLES